MKIAIIGTDGIPARYGGFETFVEQMAPRLRELGHEVLVVGSGVGRHSIENNIQGVRVINLPMRANGVSSILFDIISFFRVVWWADSILLLGVSAGLFVPIFKRLTSRGRLTVNVDGLESRRAKWKGFRGYFLALSEMVAVKSANILVADNQGIYEIIHEVYGRVSNVIAYGADHVRRLDEESARKLIFDKFQLRPYSYALTIARIEPENNIHLMIEGVLAAKSIDYVVVGNFDGSEYGRALLKKYGAVDGVKLISSVYDSRLLGGLRGLCGVYLHGHSVGGTNPSLVEMFPYCRPVVAWDCVFNRYTLRQSGAYFHDVSSLALILKSASLNEFGPPEEVRLDPMYSWTFIAERYSAILGGGDFVG